MTTADTPGCDACPLRGDTPFVPDTLVRLAPVLVLADRAGDPPVPDQRLVEAKLRRGVNVSFGAALRCRPSPRMPGGKRLEKALAACRRHDDLTGVKLIVAIGSVAWRALGLTEFSVNRGYAREVGA